VDLERFEEFDDLFLLDAALVQPKQAVGARVKLTRLRPGCPHTRAPNDCDVKQPLLVIWDGLKADS
jgi:hypothetical protein